MNTNKKLIKIAAILVGVGMLICVISFALVGFNPQRLNTENYETNTYELNENFHNININGDVEDVTLFPSDDNTCKVICREEKNDHHQVRVEGDTLTISKKEKHNFFSFGFRFAAQNQEIAVYLPSDTYMALTIESDTGDVKIPKNFTFDSINMILDTGDIACNANVKGDEKLETDTGHISIADVSASRLKLASDTGIIDITNSTISSDIKIVAGTGDVTISNITCENLGLDGDTADYIMSNVVARGEFQIESDTGTVEFDKCDAENIYVETDTGSVRGTLLTSKIFITHSDTGRIEVPKSITGGRCEITTATGNIRIDLI